MHVIPEDLSIPEFLRATAEGHKQSWAGSRVRKMATESWSKPKLDRATEKLHEEIKAAAVAERKKFDAITYQRGRTKDELARDQAKEAEAVRAERKTKD